MQYPEEKTTVINGMHCQYLCHLQQVEGKGLVWPAHYHNYIEILYGLFGSYDVWLNGSHHRFGEGDLVLIHSKEVHQINARSEGTGSYLVLRFEPELIYNRLSGNYSERSYLLPFLAEHSKTEAVIPAAFVRDTPIPSVFQNLLNELADKKYGYELAVKNDIRTICLWLLRYWHDRSKTPAPVSEAEERMTRHLAPALDYLLSNFEKEVQAADMAKLCGLSYSYFSRSFCRLMQMSFNEYRNHLRIAEAEKLLLTTDRSITEIAGAVGFSTSSYFIRLFKEEKGVSPKQFRTALLPPAQAPYCRKYAGKAVPVPLKNP